jgi:Family of unknown function (DUF6152)
LSTRLRSLPLAIVLLATASLSAHHGSAEYHVDREIVVAGTVKEWRFTNPHTWVYLVAKSSGGKAEEWSGEGPPLQWATARSWSEATLKAGEAVRLVMYPSRRDPRSGLIKRIERDGREPLLVSRPWLNEN